MSMNETDQRRYREGKWYRQSTIPLEECLREVRREFRRFLNHKHQSRPDSERYGL